MQGATQALCLLSLISHCFNPRPLCRERPNKIAAIVNISGFNPRPLCRERHFVDCIFSVHRDVSIHAPYAGSDAEVRDHFPGFIVSIHAPYAGSDQTTLIFPGVTGSFQSTPPMQGATESDRGVIIEMEFQSTPPMQGATRSFTVCIFVLIVSIHAPYAGSDW